MSAGVRVDRELWRNRRAGCAGMECHPLHRSLAISLDERLAGIRREFPSVLLLGVSEVVAARLARRDGTETVVLADGSVELAVAARRFGPAVVMDEEALPFAPEWADLVVGALTLHWTNDFVGALIQIRHCLKPDGLFLGAILGGETLRELRACLGEAEIECAGGLGLRVAPMAELRALGGALQRAGFALPVVDSEPIVQEYSDVLQLMRDLRVIGETNSLQTRGGTLRRDVLARSEALYRERYPSGAGGICATFDVLHMCGWAPHESQQKPLRPGSAAVRLADALGASEVSLGERAGPVSLSGPDVAKKGDSGR